MNHTGETSREWWGPGPAEREKAATTGCGHLQPKAKKKKMEEKEVERWANGRTQRRNNRAAKKLQLFTCQQLKPRLGHGWSPDSQPIGRLFCSLLALLT